MGILEIAILIVITPAVLFVSWMIFCVFLLALLWAVESGFFAYGICMFGFIQSLASGNSFLAAAFAIAGVGASILQQQERSA